MKLYLKFALIIITASILGCQKEVDPQIELSETATSVSPNEGSVQIAVTANSNWTATVSESWCTISPQNGDGNSSITVTASDNFSTASRSATLKVVSQDLEKEVVITQDYAKLSYDNETLSFSKEAGSVNLNITSNTKWTIEVPLTLDWATVGTISGEGDGSVTVTAEANTTGPARTSYFTIKYARQQQVITLKQGRSQNTIPSVPVITAPADNATNVATLTNFAWNASTDADGDDITYTLSYTNDNVNWTDTVLTANSVYIPKHLAENTRYSWKLSASDGMGGVATTDIYSFTTGAKSGLADKEYEILQEATAGAGSKACNIIILGDGYTAADFQEGALFDQNVEEGINSIFSVQPYKSYKDYFRVYKQAAYSTESGATQADKSITKKTAFTSTFCGGSTMTIDYEKVFTYCKMITGFTDETLKTTLVIVIVNQDRYAGTTYMWTDGSVLAIVPVSKTYSEGYLFKNVIVHEAAGHGFGGLADEYITNVGKTITSDALTEYNTWNSSGFFANIDVVSDLTTIKWKTFVGRDGYSRVGAYEGAFGYTYGVWRAESTSCMIDNEMYFNAPSRAAMVKRILERSGYSYNFDSFLIKDTERVPPTSVTAYTKSVNALTFQPLAPPVLMRK